jgi:hypothetical protein
VNGLHEQEPVEYDRQTAVTEGRNDRDPECGAEEEVVLVHACERQRLQYHRERDGDEHAPAKGDG